MKREVEFTPDTPFRLSLSALIALIISLVSGGITIGVVKRLIETGGSEMDLRLEKRVDQLEVSNRNVERWFDRTDERLKALVDRIDRDYEDQRRFYANHQSSPVTSTPLPKQ